MIYANYERELKVTVNSVLYDLEDSSQAVKCRQALVGSVCVYSLLDASVVQSVRNDDYSIEDLDDAISERLASNMVKTSKDETQEYYSNGQSKYAKLWGLYDVPLDDDIFVVQSMLDITSAPAVLALRLNIDAPVDMTEWLPLLDFDDSLIAVYEALGVTSRSDRFTDVAAKYFSGVSSEVDADVTQTLPAMVSSSDHVASVLKGSLRLRQRYYKTGNGGINSTTKDKIYRTDKATYLFEFDVSSFYPSLLVKDGFVVDGIVSAEAIAEVISLRNSSSGASALAYKLLNNILTGMMANAKGKLYAPKTRYNVIKGAQVIMAELIDSLHMVDIFKVNTDSVTVSVSAKNLSSMLEVLDTWQLTFGLELTLEQYKHVHIDDIRNYWCKRMDNTFKRRGTYARRDMTHNGLDDDEFNNLVEQEI